MVVDNELDLSGLNCPQHVMLCKAALVTMAGGELLHVVTTDPCCHHDIPLLVKAQGDAIERVETGAGTTEFWIRRHASTSSRRRLYPSRPAALRLHSLRTCY
jgi:tRNA 2-thiouridine synthesizing protein A